MKSYKVVLFICDSWLLGWLLLTPQAQARIYLPAIGCRPATLQHYYELSECAHISVNEVSLLPNREDTDGVRRPPYIGGRWSNTEVRVPHQCPRVNEKQSG